MTSLETLRWLASRKRAAGKVAEAEEFDRQADELENRVYDPEIANAGVCVINR